MPRSPSAPTGSTDREGRTDGGCAVYVRRDLVGNLVTSYSNSYYDTLAVKVNTSETLIIVASRIPVGKV
jgi:hypothetical protein